MRTHIGWLTLTVWIAFAALCGIALWDTPYDPAIFVMSVSAALAANLVLYRQRGGRWKPLIIGIIVLVSAMLGGAWWFSTHPFQRP